MPLTRKSKTLRRSSHGGNRLTSKQKRREQRRERTAAYVERSRQRELREENAKQLNTVPENRQSNISGVPINISGVPINTTLQPAKNLPVPKQPIWGRWLQR